MTDLTKPCDACGRMIGGASKYCHRCKIYFCFLCSHELMNIQGKLPLKCPMCNGELVFTE